MPPAPFGARFGGARDQGSATVWSVGAIAVLCVAFGIVLGLGQAVVVRHRAAGGADLAALAAADHWAEGRTTACALADRVARAQGTRLTRCVIVGDVSDVSAASVGGPFTAEVRARAGSAATSPWQRAPKGRWGHPRPKAGGGTARPAPTGPRPNG
ncbi:Rv3654c family TadE-like protein [Streptomyces sp. NPDC001833]|uniref:Rv3654c family TadE-like protein n=1 Tax=Streptomyces sp. NPDC001833 TaxID=3154658 RepID=UPI00332F7C6D